MYSKMEILWRQVQRWVTNCFRSTPTPILAAEVSLSPISVIAPHKHKMATLRLACAAPTQNPAAARLGPDFLSLISYRAPDSYRSLCTHLPPNVMPLSWHTQRPPSKVWSHLPVDQLANIALPLFGPLSLAPLANPHLLPDSSRLPPADTMRVAYRPLRGRAKALLQQDWKKMAPAPPYYTYPLSLVPHPFMGLGKFVAGRIHQIRAQKSYLAVHPLWSHVLDSKHCPRW